MKAQREASLSYLEFPGSTDPNEMVTCRLTEAGFFLEMGYLATFSCSALSAWKLDNLKVLERWANLVGILPFVSNSTE